MNKTSGTSKDAADKLVKGIQRKTRKQYSAEEKIRIVLAGLRGEEGVPEALEQQFEKFSTSTGSPGTRKIFGCFYNALAHSKSLKDPGDIARILREFIWDRISMPAGEKILGQVLPERRWHTVASLARETDHDPRRLRSLLVGEGVIPADAASHFAIPVRIGTAVAARLKRIVEITKLPGALNCTKPLVDQLCNERVVTPIYYGTPGIRGKLQKGVDGDEVAGLLRALEANSVQRKTEGNLVNIAKASEKAKIPAVCIVQPTCAGLLQCASRIEGLAGVSALRVCPVEVKKVSSATLVGMTASDAFATLKLNKDAGWELVARHPKVVSLEPLTIVGSDPSCAITRFHPESIAAFDARFTKLARVAQKLGPDVKQLKITLKKAKTEPALSWCQVGADIYHVSDIAKVLQN